jgi:hypothetical protein
MNGVAAGALSSHVAAGRRVLVIGREIAGYLARVLFSSEELAIASR